MTTDGLHPLTTALTDLREGLETQRLLVEEVASLRTSQKLQRALLGGLAVILVFVGVVAYVAVATSSEARTTADLVERVVALQEDALIVADAGRVESALVICRSRNGASRETRQQFLDAYTVLERFASPGNEDAFVELRANVAKSEMTDRDCDADGELSSGDYPEQ